MNSIPVISPIALRTTLKIPAGFVELDGVLELPDYAPGVVLLAHGNGGSRHNPHDQYLAETIREAGLGTLQIDLLTHRENQQDANTSALRFDIELMAQRLIGVTRWMERQTVTRGLKTGFFGTTTDGAAILLAAAELGDRIAAVVLRGGRPDLASHVLHQVCSPTLLIVGGYDEMIICLNAEASAKLRCEKDLRIVPCATHLFEEPGKLEQVAQLSAHWFSKHLGITPDWTGAQESTTAVHTT